MACAHGNALVRGAAPAPCGCSVPAVAPAVESAPIEIRLLVTAQPGLSHAAVANYIRTAVEGYSGCLRGDDPCRSIHVERVQRLGWADVGPEEM